MSKNTIQLTGPNIEKVDNTLVDNSLIGGSSGFNFLFASQQQAGPNRVLKSINMTTILEFIKNKYLPILVGVGSYYTSKVETKSTENLDIYKLTPVLTNTTIPNYQDGLIVRFLANEASRFNVSLMIDRPALTLNYRSDINGGLWTSTGDYKIQDSVGYDTEGVTYYYYLNNVLTDSNKSIPPDTDSELNPWEPTEDRYIKEFTDSYPLYVYRPNGYPVRIGNGQLLKGYYYEAIYLSNAILNGSRVDKGPIFLLINDTANEIPVGGIIGYGIPTVKSINNNYLRCDGSDKDKSLYPELYSIIQDYYGGTSTTFNLPLITLGKATSSSFQASVRVLNDDHKKASISSNGTAITFSASISDDWDWNNYANGAQVLFKVKLPIDLVSDFVFSFKVKNNNAGSSYTSYNSDNTYLGFGNQGRTYAINTGGSNKGHLNGGSNVSLKDYSEKTKTVQLLGNGGSCNIMKVDSANNLTILPNSTVLSSDNNYLSSGWLVYTTDPDTSSTHISVVYDEVLYDSSTYNYNQIITINNCILEPAEDNYTWVMSLFKGLYEPTTEYKKDNSVVDDLGIQYDCIKGNKGIGLDNTEYWRKLTDNDEFNPAETDNDTTGAKSKYLANSYVLANCYCLNINSINNLEDPRESDFNDDGNWVILSYRGIYNDSVEYFTYDLVKQNEVFYYFNSSGSKIELDDPRSWNIGYKQYQIITYGVNPENNKPYYYYHKTNNSDYNNRIPIRGTSSNEWMLGNFRDTWQQNPPSPAYKTGDIVTVGLDYYLRISDSSANPEPGTSSSSSYWFKTGSDITFNEEKYYESESLVNILTPYRSTRDIQYTYYAKSKFNFNKSQLPYPINRYFDSEGYDSKVVIRVPKSDITPIINDSNVFYIGFCRYTETCKTLSGGYVNLLNLSFTELELGYYAANGVYNVINNLVGLGEFSNSQGECNELFVVLTSTIETEANANYAYIKAR